MAWALQDAKAKFSEVVKRARSEGPQEVTLRGEPTAVVLSKADFDRLVGSTQPVAEPRSRDGKTFLDLLLDGPPWPDNFAEELQASRRRQD